MAAGAAAAAAVAEHDAFARIASRTAESTRIGASRTGLNMLNS